MYHYEEADLVEAIDDDQSWEEVNSHLQQCEECRARAASLPAKAVDWEL